MSYVVTLVHGTWAGRRQWTLEGSALRSTLERKLGSIEFRAVQWSGGNWARDRLAAAARIGTSLAQALNERPHARHFVIAHSHGGNAVMYALHDIRLQRQLAGVITLAIPFLHAGSPQFSETSAIEATAAIVMLLAGITGVLVSAGAFLLVESCLRRLGILQATPSHVADLFLFIAAMAPLIALRWDWASP